MSTDRRMPDDGTSVLAADITTGATVIGVTDAQWTSDVTQYPLQLEIDGERMVATAVATASGDQVFTVIRGLNTQAKAHAAGTPVRVARPWRLSMAHASLAGAAGQVPETPPAPPVVGGATVTVPPFNLAGATSISPGTDFAATVSAGAAGTHYRLLSGAHNLNNVRLKSGMHVRLDAGATASGSGGKVYCFRPLDANVVDVAIGGDPTATTRPKISGYGNGTKNQDYAAIMGTPDDRVGGTYTYNDVTGWTVYHLDLDSNSANGIKIGSSWGVTDCWIHGHLVCGITGDRHVGGTIADNVLWYNALDPATGAQENGAQIKLTWTNGDVGRTSITPVDRSRVTTYISRNVFEAKDRGAGLGDCDYAVWLDLDCWGVVIEHNTMTDHPGFGVFAEGCNNIEVRYNTVVNSDGFGAGLNSDFANAGICFGETTNSWAHHNNLIGCNFALMNRLSRRTFDWLNPASSTNYAYAAGSQYWLSASEAIPAIDGQSNIWTGNNRYTDNTLIGCGRVVINEGTNGAGQIVQGKTPVATIEFSRNNYVDSPGIIFDDRGTIMTLAGWQALGRQ